MCACNAWIILSSSAYQHTTRENYHADVIRKMIRLLISHLHLFAFLTIIRHESFTFARLWSVADELWKVLGRKFDLCDTKLYLKMFLGCFLIILLDFFFKCLKSHYFTLLRTRGRNGIIFLWMLTSNCHSNWVYIYQGTSLERG